MIPATKRRRAWCTALLCANLLFIWGNSLLPASVSGAFSSWVRDLLWFLPPPDPEAAAGDGLLRKMAHFLEFCLLGILLSWLFAMRLKEKWAFLLPAFGCSCLTACIDEILQYFAPGRSPGVTDVIIDLSGAVLGMLLLSAGCFIHQKRKPI